MNKKLYQQSSNRVISSFQQVLKLMDNIKDSQLEVKFMIWKAQNGVGNLLKKFLFQQGLSSEENSFVGKKVQESDGISHFLQVDHFQIESVFQQQDIAQKYLKKDKKQKQYIRGPYKKYTEEEKRNAIYLYEKGQSLTKISKKMKIPIKNIKRWSEKGVDEIMNKKNNIQYQQKLIEKIREIPINSVLTLEQVKNMIEKFPEISGMKNDKKWIKNLLQKHNIHEFYDIQVEI